MIVLAALCVLFGCGALAHPSVWLVYVDQAPDAAVTAGVRAIVEGGYLPYGPGTLEGVSTATVLHTWYGTLPYVTDADVLPLVRADVDITLLVLPEEIHAEPPDAQCGGCLYTSSYHQVTADGHRYAVLSGRIREPLRELGYPDDQPLALYDAAHELVEAAADAEIADACAPPAGVLLPWRGYMLPAYRLGNVCLIGGG